MRKKIATPAVASRGAQDQQGWLSTVCVAWITCSTTTVSAAIARSESNSGKRGLPGGGATASGASVASGEMHVDAVTRGH